MLSDLAQIGLVRSKGFSSWLIRAMTHSNWNHTILRVGDRQVISAESSGVTLMPEEYFPDTVWSQFIFHTTEAELITQFALKQQAKPYGTLTYVWIGIALLLRIKTPAWLEARISDGHTWICSALCDAAYQSAGLHLFTDERPVGAVVPGSIAKIFVDYGWTDKP